MLIIATSLGFGTIKIKLGSRFKIIIGIGFLQFMVTSTETIVQLNKTNSNHTKNVNFYMFVMARVLIDGYATFKLFKLIHLLIFPLFIV